MSPRFGITNTYDAALMLQLNDPDWECWTIAYALAALVAATYAARGAVSRDALVSVGVAIAILWWSIGKTAIQGLSTHGFTLEAMEKVEAVREGGGLAILAAWTAILATLGQPSASGAGAGTFSPLVWGVAAAAPSALLYAWVRWLDILRTTVNPDLPAHCNSTFNP